MGKLQNFTFRIPEKLLREVRKAAQQDRRSVGNWIRLRLEEALSRR